jgi:hypothetical protein
MSRANIPRPDSQAASFMRHLARTITEQPEVYHIAPDEAAEVTAAVTAFRSALAITSVRQARSMADVSRKNDARAEAERLCRWVYGVVRRDPRISDADKILAGVRPPKSGRTRSAAPQSRPVLHVRKTDTSHTIRWMDENTLHRWAKPAGCAMLQLFAVVGPKEATDMSRAKLVNVYTGNRVSLVRRGLMRFGTLEGLPMADVAPEEARVVTYIARWAGPTGQPGPWSAPRSLPLAA